MDEMIDTHLYPHGSYAMGALDNLSDVKKIRNDKKDLAFKVEGDDHFVDPTPNRVDHCNLTL